MRNLLVIFLLFIFQSVKAQNPELKTIAESIKLENLKEKVYFLASDSLQGRKTYKKGQRDAAVYIASEFKSIHLAQLEGADEYYQKFVRYRLKDSFCPILKDGKFILSTFFCNSPVKDTSEVEFVFAGRATEKDLKGLDINNKTIVFFVDSLIEGIDKVNKLSKIYPETGFAICMNNKRHYRLLETMFKQKLLKISEVKSFKDLKEYFSRLYLDELSGEKLSTAEFISDRLDTSRNIGFSAFGEKELEKLFGIKAKECYKITRKNQKSKKNQLIGLANLKAKILKSVSIDIDTLFTENVIACIEGTEKKDEAIIITAHYDHVGKSYNGGLCLGANDNASGTAALMEIAGAFAKAQKNGLNPKRTVIFIAFTGEEEGLVGSWHYVNNPLFPLNKTVCNINMDMVGRNHKDKVKNAEKVIILGRNKDKHKRIKTFKRTNKQYHLLKIKTHLSFVPKLSWLFGSDHHAFQMKDVPSTIVTGGDDHDYHTPGDTPDKINYEKLTNISKLVFLTAWQMANQ